MVGIRAYKKQNGAYKKRNGAYKKQNGAYKKPCVQKTMRTKSKTVRAKRTVETVRFVKTVRFPSLLRPLNELVLDTDFLTVP
jgi:hypothetical protein